MRDYVYVRSWDAGQRGEGANMEDLNPFIEPGMIVRHPGMPEWGSGQIQSKINERVTVNFAEVGKVVIDGSRVALVQVFNHE